MATARAEELLKTISNDVVLRQKLESATTPEERREIINAAGYSDVSRENLQAAVAEHSTSSELSDAELEAVAGGATTGWIGISVAVTIALATL
jgi:predicted ribosomally synthesized peptide with nif11-like leader